MTKQDEIREAIDTYTDDGCLFPNRSCNALGSGYCSSMEESYKCLMERLGDIGCVLKVEGELPMWLKFKWAKNPCLTSQGAVDEQFTFDIIEDAGYTLTESLIKEKE